MARVFLPSQWRRPGEPAQFDSEAATLRGVLDDLLRRRPDLAGVLGGPSGPSPQVAISVDGSLSARLGTAVSAASEVHFLPAIGAG